MALTKYVWDGDNILYETDDTNAVTAEYTYSPERYGRLIAETRDGVTYMHYYDAQGSTVGVTDDIGAVTDTFAYTAWGEESARTGTTPTPFRWIGQFGYYWDEELSQFHVRARPYGPPCGRWTTQDPLHLSDGPDPYLYVRNAPVSLYDPSGLRLACCNMVLYDTVKACCESKTVVSKVPLWICERPLDMSPWPGGFGYALRPVIPRDWELAHSYICCAGENLDCYGKQAKQPSGRDTKKGDPVPREMLATGDCDKVWVCPAVKKAKCSSPTANEDYSIWAPGYESCHDWARCGVN